MSTTWHTRAELELQIVTLAHSGMSRRAITRAVGVSRNTVKHVLRSHAQARATGHPALAPKPQRVPRQKKMDAFTVRASELLARYPDITAQRVHEILRAEGFDGGYTAVKKFLRTSRPPTKPEPSLRAPEYGPGEMAESDWSKYPIRFTTGIQADVQMFSYVLTYSPRKFFSPFDGNDLFALMDGHVQAFDRFGGCASVCTYDGQKPVALRWEGTQPIYNPRFLAFAAHYEFRPRAVRGDPNAKPRVERSFWEFERSFLNGRSFRDMDDLRAQLLDWLDHVVDQRRRRGHTCLERFAVEKDKLIPLPRHPYDTARVVYRVCSIDGFVDWDGNRYAVPYDHVTDILPVRITQRELFVYAADLRCVARHELGPRGAGLKLDPAGLHPAPLRRSPIDLDQLAMAFEQIGEGARVFFRLLSAGPARTCGHQGRQILQLRARYDTKDVDAALAHAARFGAMEYRAVERILQARCQPRTLDEYVSEQLAQHLQQTLGERPTQPRDLCEYDRLPPTTPDQISTPHTLPHSAQKEASCPSDPQPPDATPAVTSTTSPSNGSENV